MLRHLFKLIWKRKTRNVMLSLEILLAFVLVFGIAAFGIRMLQLYHMPIGFVKEDLWTVLILPVEEVNDRFDPGVYDQFKRGLESLPEVKQVAFANMAPYAMGGMRTSFRNREDAWVQTELMEVSDDFFAVMGIQLKQGRGFGRDDDGAAMLPVVVNQHFVDGMLPSGPVLGKRLNNAKGDDDGSAPMQVVGVVEDLRKAGELGLPDNLIIMRYKARLTKSAMRNIILRMEPGIGRDFEQKLGRQLKLINPAWNYQITPVSAARTSMLMMQTSPLLVLSVIAAFLLVMVAFGLFGVLWQNTTRRIPEIGLRRAVGASAGAIYRQIIAEQLLLSTGAMVVALFLLLQLPLTGVLGQSLNWTVFLAASALSMAAIYLLSLLCSIYPAWRASRLSPSAALHYE